MAPLAKLMVPRHMTDLGTGFRTYRYALARIAPRDATPLEFLQD
jgi:hypothetical protein